MFAIQAGGWCSSSADAGSTYNMYGTSTACRDDGTGGPWANQVYNITGNHSTIERLLEVLEIRIKLYQIPEDPNFSRLKTVWHISSYWVRSLQCTVYQFTHATSQFETSLNSTETGLVDLGCFRDTASRAIPTLEQEGQHTMLDGEPYYREDPIEKCRQAAISSGKQRPFHPSFNFHIPDFSALYFL